MMGMLRLFLTSMLLIYVLNTIGYTDQVVRLAAGQNYYPYYAEDLEDGGFITKVIVSAFNKMGYRVEVEFVPWARATHLVKTGAADGIYSIWFRKDRESWVAFSDPLYSNITMILKRKETSVVYKTLLDLTPYTIGIVRGYSYTERFNNATYLNKIYVTDNLQNIKLLKLKRLDLILIDQMVGSYLIHSEPELAGVEFEWLEPPLESLQIHVGFSKKVKDYLSLVNTFNEGLMKIKADGTYDAIVNKANSHYGGFCLFPPKVQQEENLN